MTTKQRRLLINVQCPHCSSGSDTIAHEFRVLVILESASTGGQLLFGGAEPDGLDDMTAAVDWSILLLCPVSQQRFSYEMRIPVNADERLLSATDVTNENQLDGTRDSGEDEFDEWRKASVSTGRSHATTMLSTSTGAVAVYLAILKYLGFETLGERWRVASILPPLAFLVAAVAYALALRPVLARVEDMGSFVKFRDQRLKSMNRYILVGTVAFVTGVGIAAGLSLVLLHR